VAKRYGNYIGGAWKDAASGRTFDNRNPADTSDLIGSFAESGPEDVERAVACAREAYPRWKALPAPKRGEILYRAAEILVKRKEDFSRDMTREMGKVLDETRGDVQEAIDMTYYMAGEGRRSSARRRRPRCPTSSRCRCASRSASPASSRRGTSRWRSPRGR
jgi:aldehyde dehydrogenase (NAD+)